MNKESTTRVILLCNNSILLLKKNANSKNPGKYEFPGGKIDSLVDIASEASRELAEETKILVNQTQLTQIEYTYKYSFRFKEEHFERNVYFFITKLDELKTPMLNQLDEDKHEEFRWIELEKYQDMLIEGKISSNSTIPLNFIKIRL